MSLNSHCQRLVTDSGSIHDESLLDDGKAVPPEPRGIGRRLGSVRHKFQDQGEHGHHLRKFLSRCRCTPLYECACVRVCACPVQVISIVEHARE